MTITGLMQAFLVSGSAWGRTLLIQKAIDTIKSEKTRKVDCGKFILRRDSTTIVRIEAKEIIEQPYCPG